MNLVMNFEHIATQIPYNVKLTLRQNILFRLGFENKIIDEVMAQSEISDYEYFYEGVTSPLFTYRRRKTNG